MSEVKAGIEKRGFEAEVTKLLKMMVHSVYSDREIFLRELISNASDACDKLRYEALTNADLLAGEPDFAIDIIADAEAGTLTINDNGVGMSKDELVENLGTIARSGTEGFMSKMTGDAKADLQLIGQFGVGFYSVFMVADKVDVHTRRAGLEEAWTWSSDGEGEYTLAPSDKEGRGTTIVMQLKDDAKEFLERMRLQTIVRTYSDHIAMPISLAIKEDEKAKSEEASSEDASGSDDSAAEIINEGSALWTRPKSDITEEQYTEFYRHVGHAFDTPAHTLHYSAEGMQQYTVLMFIPEERPMDLFDPARKSRVKLYVKRVFITDETQEILPGWLRFMRGVIDSEDLPLNISREMLQNNPVLRRISGAVTKKVLSELKKLADKKPEVFTKIWESFGAVIKEGIYEDHARRDDLVKLAHFRSTGQEGWTTLADYISRMKDKQEKIYYITGADEAAVARSPQLEGFKSRGVEVLLLSDPVDDFWLQMVPEFEGKALQSITRGTTDLSELGDKSDDSDVDKAQDGDMVTLVTMIKEVLGEKVVDVRSTDRLTDTAVCLVADEGGMDIHLERMLKAHDKSFEGKSSRVMEINPSHPLVKSLAERAKEKGAADTLSPSIELLFDQALILEGEMPLDPAAFAKRMSQMMTGERGAL